MKTHRFSSMGTAVTLVGPDSPGFDAAAQRVVRVFTALDARFSRFRPESELSAVNARAGQWTPVSAEFAELLGIALNGARLTGGLFDPTILPALLAAGYDRDFSLLQPADHAPAVTHRPEAAGRRWSSAGWTCASGRGSCSTSAAWRRGGPRTRRPKPSPRS